MDLTLTNPAIKAYFERTSEDIPIGEFIYVHTHFLEQNFLSDIEVLLNKATLKLNSDPKVAAANSSVILKLAEYAQNYALQCNVINDNIEEAAKEMLINLREIYTLCKVILK